MNTRTTRPAPIGNRMALTGAVLFLLEWVAILGSGLVGAPQGVDPAAARDQVVAAYAGTENGSALVAGWMAVVLTGRVLFVVGLRAGLDASGRSHPLMGFAASMMSISVALEIASAAVTAGAAKLAAEGSPEGLIALDRASTAIFNCVYGAFGLAVLCAAWCMWRSRLFPTVLNVLGLAGGLSFLFMQLIAAPSFKPLFDALDLSAPLLVFVWMVWTGIRLWRHTPRKAAQPASNSTQVEESST
jgi:hypothetical protein